MTSNAMFEGVFCPSITITKENGSVDYDNWGRHLDHLADSGIDGVLLFGSIGEFYSIDVHTKAEVVKFAVSRVAGRMKVLVGVGDTNLDNVRTLAAESEAWSRSPHTISARLPTQRNGISPPWPSRRPFRCCYTISPPGPATTYPRSWWPI